MLARVSAPSNAVRPRLQSQVTCPAICRFPRSLPCTGAKQFTTRSLKLVQPVSRCSLLRSRRAATQRPVIKSEAATFTSESNKAAKPLRIVFVSAEVGPWSKTGGLGDVVGGLPIALAQRGHNVMTIAPRYWECCDGRIGCPTGLLKHRCIDQRLSCSNSAGGILQVRSVC